MNCHYLAILKLFVIRVKLVCHIITLVFVIQQQHDIN